MKELTLENLKIKVLKYFEVLKVSYYSGTAYIGDVLGIAGMVVVRIWLFKQLYAKAFALAGTSQIGGLSFAQTIWILALTQSFHVSNRTRMIMKSIEDDIKQGTIANSIARPYSYILFNFFNCFGVLGSNVFITVFLAAIVAVVLAGTIKVTFIGILSGLFLLTIGFAINNLAILIVGLSAFWAEDVSAFRWIYDKLFWVFGGIFLPPSLIPAKFQWFVEFLPFNQIFYGPARLMISFDSHLFVKYFLIQIAWLIIFVVVLNFMYKKGIKNLSLNGG